jgi:integrase
LGCRVRSRSPSPFFSYRPGSVWLFRGAEERGEPQADPGGTLFCLPALDLKNPFAKIDPPIQKEPQIRYLLLADIRRLLDHLKGRARQSYGSVLAFHLANALFQTACRFDELIQVTWTDCQAVGKEIVALRIKGKGSVFQDVPVTSALSAALLEWKEIQKSFKARRIRFPGGIAFAGSQFVFAGYSGAPFTNRAFNLRLRAACRALGVGTIPGPGIAAR